MFKLIEPETINLKVMVTPPQDPAKTRDKAQKITLKMKYAGRRVRNEYVKRVQTEVLLDDQIIQDWIVDWDGVIDQHGAPIDFADTAMRERVLDVPWVYTAIIQAVITELMTNPAPAAEKN